MKTHNATEPSLSPLRHAIAVGAIFLIIFAPLIATTKHSSETVNQIAALAQVFFILALLPEALREAINLWFRYRIFKLFVLCILLCLTGWILLFIPIGERPRSFAYAVQPFFLFACIGWFKTQREWALNVIFYLKSISLFVALAAFAYYLATASSLSEKSSFLANPPIYRNLRHLNYDLAIVFGCCFFLSVKTQRALSHYTYIFAFATLGYFAIWSGGRGAFLSIGVFIFTVCAFKNTRPCRAKIARICAAFSFGAFLVFSVGEDYFFTNSIHLLEPLQSLNDVSSGRLGIWQESLTRIRASWLVGFGPDGFRDSFPSLRNILHPHNFIIQMLFEFGIVGSIGLFTAIVGLLFQCWKIIRTCHQLTASAAVAALFVATIVYSLVDGHFYHALPLSFILIMCAYIISVTEQKGAANAFCHQSDIDPLTQPMCSTQQGKAGTDHLFPKGR